MKEQDIYNTQKTDNRIFLNGKQLAEVLSVSPPSLSEAVRKGYNCAGYPVVEWAVETESGRVKGFDVPEFLVNKKSQMVEERPNPQILDTILPKSIPNEANLVTNEPKPEQKAIPTDSGLYNYSVLPDGEDYFKPVSTVAIASVLKKAIEKDTPQSRAIVSSLLMVLGAITGHAVTDKASGAGVGAIAGLGTAVLAYTYLNPNIVKPNEVVPQPNTNKKAIEHSGYLKAFQNGSLQQVT